MNVETFKIKLLEWDQKTSKYLKNIYLKFNHEKNFIKILLSFLKEKELQKASTWLLKCYLEDSKKLTNKQITELFLLSNLLQDWESQLHLLQSLKYLEIRDETLLEKFLEKTLKNEKTFVRAWTYTGLDLLSSKFPKYKEKVDKIIQEAYLMEEKASIKVRLKKILN